MYERFTDRARKVMQLANQEAQRFNHEYIGTEHLLLGLIKEGSGVAGRVLEMLKINPQQIRTAVESLIKSGPEAVTMGKLPQTPRAKKVIEYAMLESRDLKHSYVGSEHILLGLIREDGGIASEVLRGMGVVAEVVRACISSILGTAPPYAETLPRHTTFVIEMKESLSAVTHHVWRQFIEASELVHGKRLIRPSVLDEILSCIAKAEDMYRNGDLANKE